MSAKAGRYLERQTDLTVVLGGVNVDLTRVYDSLGQDQVGSFGAGWRLATVDSQVQVDVAQTGREAFGVYNPFRVGTRLYLTTPTGELGKTHMFLHTLGFF